ncbi:hypothetical protein FIBSPDRAFT_740187 [Athelia psychrophila]|uniref:Prolyl endopeptidase n=1 Tax=Athelia psychrophila TaxID=1759441 RepID=A0A166KBK4_9AGAM|nr:hypothetical protein FIBSPDRAFT_740187 [Fibularhizoctonia sp. CBS 109695]
MAPTPWKPNCYPTARRSSHVDEYKSELKGLVKVADPYQWLEKNTPETEEWVSAQEAFTRAYLDQNPDRVKLEDEIRKNMDYAKVSAPSLKYDGRWYWYYNSGLQAQSVLYRSKDSKLPDFSKDIGPGGEVFFDPNLLSTDGTASLGTAAFSKGKGEYYAYGISLSGSDFCTIYVRRTDSPLAEVNGVRPEHHDSRLPEEIRFVKFSTIVWTHDSKGFFYQRYPDRESHGLATEDKAGTETDGDINAMVYYHRLGTQQSDDVLVMKDPENPEWMWGMDITETDGRYLSLYVLKNSDRKNMLWVTDLETNEIGPNMKWDKLVNTFDAEYDVLANDGTKFYLRTNEKAPQYKVVTTDIADKNRAFKELIPEDKDAHLEDVTVVADDKLVVVYKRNVKDEIYLYSLAGERLTRLAEDFVGAAYISGRRSRPDFFITLTGFTTPGVVARYDFSERDEKKRWSVHQTTKVNGLDPEDFLAEQVWYASKDGTKVPMFIVRHKSTKFDGTAPAIQYGYGGFSISIGPFFSPSILTFLQRYGAVLAVPNIRGGGEFGETWHEGGTKERKQNVFDDFIAATQYLVDNKYVGAGQVAINGGSNGGLLVAACVNQAPEGLIGVAVAEVGVLDLLKFADFTIGKAWVSDYGNPHDAHDFDFIHPLSPLHNIPTDRIFPPTILHTADHDDRVVPLHSFKHAAALQHTLPNNPNPLLIRIDTKSGHGAGKATEQRIKEAADRYGFIAQSLGLKWKDTVDQ